MRNSGSTHSARSIHLAPVPATIRYRMPQEGYVFPVYGPVKYLKMALAAIKTLRRVDDSRPIALACEYAHIQVLERLNLTNLIDDFIILEPQHCSITGFKHHVWKFQLYPRTLFLDCDMVFCKNPDRLWQSLYPYEFTATGSLTSDPFFGGPKGLAVIKDILFQRRRKTLSKFGVTYLNRVQSGVMYVRDNAKARKICATAASCLNRMDETHFQSRLKESGRTEESCEWSLAIAMALHQVPVYPWIIGHESAQLDFIADLTDFTPDFTHVECTVHTAPLVYALRGMSNYKLRRFLTRLLSTFSGRGDFMRVTPYILHFGWLHEKKPFLKFADKHWQELTREKNTIQEVTEVTVSSSLAG
jgi:hypothetical protein